MRNRPKLAEKENGIVSLSCAIRAEDDSWRWRCPWDYVGTLAIVSKKARRGFGAFQEIRLIQEFIV